MTPDAQQKEIEWLKESLIRIEKSVNKMSDKFDMYNERFETKANSLRERERLQEQINNKADKEDVSSIQNSLAWITRLIIGLVVTAIIGLVLTNI